MDDGPKIVMQCQLEVLEGSVQLNRFRRADLQTGEKDDKGVEVSSQLNFWEFQKSRVTGRVPCFLERLGRV